MHTLSHDDEYVQPRHRFIETFIGNFFPWGECARRISASARNQGLTHNDIDFLNRISQAMGILGEEGVKMTEAEAVRLEKLSIRGGFES
jgi:hypothetical protein